MRIEPPPSVPMESAPMPAAVAAEAPPEEPPGVFAGFHGQFDLTGIENEENPLLWVGTESGEHRTVVGNDTATVGHIDTLLNQFL